MKPKTMMSIVLAIGCGLVASYITSRLLAERGQTSNQNTKKVLVAIQKVPMFTALKEPEKFFAEKDVPEDAVPKKALTSLEELKGKKLNKTINEEAFVYVDDLLDPKSDGMAAMLSSGQRAVAIKVDAQSLVGGFVLPGSRVDVVCTLRRSDSETESKIILQDMLVLAVDTKSNKEEGTPTIIGQTVTLAAKPEEAQQLSLASTIGELRLLLRGSGDNQVVRLQGAKLQGLGKQRFDPSATEENDNSNLIAQTPVPAVLPPLPAKTETPLVEAPKAEPEPPPTKTHTLTITSGEYTTRHVFVADDNDGWKSSVDKSDLGDARPARRTDAPPITKVSKPDAPPPAVSDSGITGRAKSGGSTTRN